ncbi:FUSC family protein [Sphingobacterium griseoflavum]|uniref:Membrane protein n=1 Tax=Sphingobacterium griseoflavum TaxID=1474952 RepID=A0ABQ3HZK7_9SPHI|nr:FUSC family membrane protein [Sphingobacterium griseoflavum]GHE47780.1 membrane protein [Sphingobacterium griseoflavum]
MEKSKEISNFFYGQYFSEGLKITVGCIVPVLVSAYLGYFNIGTLISLGALLVGLSDTPGAPSHRRLGMLSTALLCMLTYIIIIHVNQSIGLTTVTVAILSFVFAMFAIFNARAATVGAMCTLMMLFNVHHELVDEERWMYLLYIAMGGSWYMLISMSILQIRPYRIAQQELSESIRQVADYIRLKANFYDPNIDVDANYVKLIEKQIEVNRHQELVRDILFQSKRSIKDTTKIGRFLTLIFADIVDLFEQSMTTQYDYNAIKTAYGQHGVLMPFKHVLIKLTHELDNMAYAINANRMPKPIYKFEQDIDRLRETVDQLDKNIGNTIPLKKIIINIRGIVKFIEDIYSYSSSKISEIPRQEIDSASQFITRDQIDWKKFRSNLSLESSVFRHALRMAIVLSGTYLTLSLINFNPNGIYWTLLTIMVILKPGFGLTQERNVQRLVGTLIGGIIGAAIVFTIQDPAIRFVLLIFFFLTAYSLFRVNYIIAVMFMTPYVLIMLSFNGMNSFDMAKERVFDTFLGGAIAFISSYIIFPNWESTQFRDNMRSLLIANYNYIAQAIQILAGHNLSRTTYKLARKEVYIASANMGSTFQRMLTEPKWRQKYTKEINRFVILNHIFSSYSANLLTEVNQVDIGTFNSEHVKLLKKILSELGKAIALLPAQEHSEESFHTAADFPLLEEHTVSEEDSALITEQLQFLSKISGDLHRVTDDLVARSKTLEQNEKIGSVDG